MLGIAKEDARCPTIRVERRMGRDRARVEMDVPALGNFLFVRWNGELYWANYLEKVMPFISIMRLPHGGYATCSEQEIEAINTLPPAPISDEVLTDFGVGDEVIVNDDVKWLAGITGEVVRFKRSGEVVLRVINNRGLKLSTLLIHGSLLTIHVNASD